MDWLGRLAVGFRVQALGFRDGCAKIDGSADLGGRDGFSNVLPRWGAGGGG